jgi:RNA polymerase-binding transcription factor DksA
MDLERARARLEREKERLLAIRRGLMGENGTAGAGPQSTGELSSYDQHPGDLGSETYEQEQTATLLAQVDQELGDIEAALKRVDEGTYGYSVLSGDPIPEERLEALPAARYTVEEQARLERGERATKP